jgi:hypothetical protein
MKNFYRILSLVLISSCAHNDFRQNEKILQFLLDSKEYFKLKSKLALYENAISDEKKLYFSSFVNNAFNRNLESIKNIDTIFSNYPSVMTDSLKANLLLLQEDNYFKTFQYTKSADADNELINHYKPVLDSNKYADIKNSFIVRNALRNVEPQQTTHSGDASITWKKNMIGLIEIPVRKMDSVFDCVFDTRASISTITSTYAKKMGLKMLDVSYTEGSGITGKTFKCSLGIADSIWIGNILVRNAVFQVVPDEILYFSSINFGLHVLIGYPVISQLKEVHIFQNGSITIPGQSSTSTLNNLALDRLTPVVSCKTDDDTLCFQFDTGATSSVLYSTYFRKNKAKIIKEGVAQTVDLGGAGGTVRTDMYVLKTFNLQIGNKKATLKELSVRMEPIPGIDLKFYGNLGQDVIGQFNEMILNFDQMYIDFK